MEENAQSSAIPLRVLVVDSVAEAQKLLDQLRRGTDFAVLAREKSTDATALDGGFMGSIDPATLRTELRDALHGLVPGQLSQIVNLPTGFAILKVLAASGGCESREAQQARQFAISAAGNIRYSFDISGLNETEAAFSMYPKPDGWEQDLQRSCEIRRQSLASGDERARNLLHQTNSSSTPEDVTKQQFDLMSALVARGQLRAYMGQMSEAIEQWETAYCNGSIHFDLCAAVPGRVARIGYLHKSEMDNEAYRRPGERCLFPMGPGTKYKQTAASETEIQHFLKYLGLKPGDLEVKWLLNLAYMTLGTYPGAVPKEYLLPPSSFASSEDIGRFTDVAPEAV